jgi:hypothetical protein
LFYLLYPLFLGGVGWAFAFGLAEIAMDYDLPSGSIFLLRGELLNGIVISCDL